MTSLSRRKHQITALNPPQPIHPSERGASRIQLLHRIKRIAFGGLLIAGTLVAGVAGANAQQYQQTTHQPRLLKTPVHATQNMGAQPVSQYGTQTEKRTSLSLIRMKDHSSSAVRNDSAHTAHIEVPDNPLRPKGVTRRINADGNGQPQDISRSVAEILSASKRSSHVQQASAIQDIEFDDSEVEIIELDTGDAADDWQRRRHVKQDVTPFPLQLSAARSDESVEPKIEPKNDPFGDSEHSVLKSPKRSRTQTISYPKRSYQDGEDGEEIELGSPMPDDSDDPDRDVLPEKRDEDRQFETNCDDVASQVATRSVSHISLQLRPEIQGDDSLPLECPMAHVGNPVRCWNAQTFTFTASALCHKPLYFEDIQLERYGHSSGPFLQPLQSAAHFFIRLGLLPYQMGIHPPNECVYALGYYRPGDCAPWLRDPFPVSGRGMLYQAGFAVGAAAIIP